MVRQCLRFHILFLPIVCLFFFDLRINYDPDKHIDLAQRRHDHRLVLAMILLTNGSLRTFTN